MKKDTGTQQLEDALKLAIAALKRGNLDEMEAASLLELGTLPVKKKSKATAVLCSECGYIGKSYDKCEGCGSLLGWGHGTSDVKAQKTWEEHYELKIQKIKTKPEFQRIAEKS